MSLTLLTQAKKSPPKKAKTVLDSSSDEENVAVSRAPRAGRAKAAVKYFEELSDSDDKENENTRDWSDSGSDFVEDDE